MTKLTHATFMYLVIGVSLFAATVLLAAPFTKHVVNRAADAPSEQVVSLQ